MPLRRTRSLLWTILALALGLALRVGFILHFPRIAGDTLVYGGIAKNWMLHGVYGWVENAGVPQPTLIRLPGYPLFLMACFRVFGVNQYTAVMLVQMVVDLLACLLLAELAGRLFGPRARIAALWLGAMCPFTASYVAAPLTETLTLASMAVAFYAFWRWGSAGAGFNRWLVAITGALAYSILLRPEQGLLAAAMLPAMLWVAWRREQRVGAALPVVVVVALGTLLPLVPWTVRNERTFHVFEPLAPRFATDPGEFVPLGFQRWYRTWAVDFASTEDVYWNYDGAAIQLGDLPSRAFDSADQYRRTVALLDDYNEHTTATPELDERFAELAGERTTAHPLRSYVALPVARVLNMALRPRVEMFSTPLAWWRYWESPRQAIFAGAYAGLNLIYLVLAGWGGWLWWRSGSRRPLFYAMLGTVLLRCALLLTLDNSEPRYTLEFFPVVFVFAARALALQQVGSWCRG